MTVKKVFCESSGTRYRSLSESNTPPSITVDSESQTVRIEDGFNGGDITVSIEAFREANKIISQISPNQEEIFDLEGVTVDVHFDIFADFDDDGTLVIDLCEPENVRESGSLGDAAFGITFDEWKFFVQTVNELCPQKQNRHVNLLLQQVTHPETGMTTIGVKKYHDRLKTLLIIIAIVIAKLSQNFHNENC